MTVAELIKILGAMPQEAEVVIYEHLCGLYGPHNKNVNPFLDDAWRTSYYHTVPNGANYGLSEEHGSEKLGKVVFL